MVVLALRQLPGSFATDEPVDAGRVAPQLVRNEHGHSPTAAAGMQRWYAD